MKNLQNANNLETQIDSTRMSLLSVMERTTKSSPKSFWIEWQHCHMSIILSFIDTKVQLLFG